jgi:hypothetical protein
VISISSSRPSFLTYKNVSITIDADELDIVVPIPVSQGQPVYVAAVSLAPVRKQPSHFPHRHALNVATPQAFPWTHTELRSPPVIAGKGSMRCSSQLYRRRELLYSVVGFDRPQSGILWRNVKFWQRQSHPHEPRTLNSRHLLGNSVTV